MSRVALLTECQHYNKDKSFEEQLVSVGGNTGNNAYITALKDIFNASHLNYGGLDKALHEDLFDIYLVGNLSWIVESKALPDFYYEAFKKIRSKGKKFVPISVGTQTSEYKVDFNYHPDTLSFLKEISEQSLIGCRGEYTAEILKKNGVTNIEVIGCPSLFHTKDPDFKINKSKELPENPNVATGITPWPNKNMPANIVIKYFEYISKNNIDYIEQASMNWIDHISKTHGHFRDLINNYFQSYYKIFFDINEWREYSSKLNFSFGARFHGNVIPLLEGVPALFVSIDARTKEMCDYFKFPTIDIKRFDFNTSINELYELTDYSEFNHNYKKLYNRFVDFAHKNNLVISSKLEVI